MEFATSQKMAALLSQRSIPAEVLEDARTSGSDVALRDLVWTMPVATLIADYTPVVDRYRGRDPEEVAQLLQDDQELLACLDSIEVRAQSRPWAVLYSAGTDDVPGLAERLADPAGYPNLRSSLIEQMTAPLRNVTTLAHEHAVPTSGSGRVIVESL